MIFFGPSSRNNIGLIRVVILCLGQIPYFSRGGWYLFQPFYAEPKSLLQNRASSRLMFLWMLA